MSFEPVIVKMLGGFSIQRGANSIDDRSNRMRKVWLLLAYLIYHRNTRLTQDNYIALLHGKNDDTVDLSANLKAMFYRVRTMLDQMDGTAGHDLILRKGGTYIWNPDVPLQLDTVEFEQLCREGDSAETELERLELYQKALELYRGDFLPKLSMEAWVMPLNAYYHRIYLETVEKTLLILSSREQWISIGTLCDAALKVEPYSELLYQYRMRSRIALGDRAGALTAYEEMSDLLYSTFGVMPSEESRAIYRDASRTMDSKSLAMDAIREQLQENRTASTALFCDYDFFKVLYQSQARSLIRNGDIVHIALFTVQGQDGKELPRRSLDRAMENLKELLLNSLRQGDIVTQCSLSQLLVLLPQANYENSCAVSTRLTRAFFRQYPHSPADIRVVVQPMEPMSPLGAEPFRN